MGAALFGALFLALMAFRATEAAQGPPPTLPLQAASAPAKATARLVLVDPVLAKGMLLRSSDGEPVGFLRDLVVRALETQGISATIIRSTPELLETGPWPDADAIVALSISDERTKRFEFSAPIIVAPGVTVVKAGTRAPTTIDELRKLRVAVARNGAGHQWCLENSVPTRVQGTMQEMLMSVVEGRVDACVTTQILWRSHASIFGIQGLTDHEITSHPFQRAFALAVAPEAKWLTYSFNVGLAALRDSGEYDAIYSRWLGGIAPRPLSASARSARTWAYALGIAAVAFAVGIVVMARNLRDKSTQLGHQTRLHRAFADAVPTLAYAYYVGDDGSRRQLWCNSRISEWTQLFPYLIPGTDYRHTFRDHIHPDDIAGYDRATEASRRGQSRFHAEYRLRDVNGRFHAIVSICTPTHVDGGTVWQGLITDRTEIRESANMAVVAERNYHAVFARCHDAALILDPQTGAIIECNERACALYGLSREQLLSRTLSEFTDEPREVLGVTEPAEVRQQHRASGGRSLVAEISVSRIEFGGRPVTLALVRDATVRTLDEEAARSRRDVLERSNRLESLGRTSGGAAHAFNNYLTAIVGNLELARFEAPAGWIGHAALDRASESASRAASLARQMLLAAGSGSTHRSRVAFDRLVEDTWPLLLAAVPSRIQLVHLRPQSSPVVRGDPDEFRQAILNLVFNAADSIGEGVGKIVVTTGAVTLSGEQLTRSLAETPTPGPHAYVEVSDDGAGVPPEMLARVFEPFFSTRGPGRGLGLSVTLGIARRFGGGVEFFSRNSPKKPGVSVRIVIPELRSDPNPESTSKPIINAKPASYIESTPENNARSCGGPSGDPDASRPGPLSDTRI